MRAVTAVYHSTSRGDPLVHLSADSTVFHKPFISISLNKNKPWVHYNTLITYVGAQVGGLTIRIPPASGSHCSNVLYKLCLLDPPSPQNWRLTSNYACSATHVRTYSYDILLQAHHLIQLVSRIVDSGLIKHWEVATYARMRGEEAGQLTLNAKKEDDEVCAACPLEMDIFYGTWALMALCFSISALCVGAEVLLKRGGPSSKVEGGLGSEKSFNS